jgi:hypothetical protein
VPADRGFNFFAGGPHQVSRARQTIDLLPLGADIFDEIVHYTFSAALGGFATDEDNAMLSMSFLDVASNPLGPPITLGPVTAADRGLATGFVNRSVEGTLPGATARIRVELAFTIASGFYNDGYADNLSLVLDSPREPRCAGDCAGARRVGTEDIVLLVDIALGNATTSACPLGIPEGASVTAPLIVEAVRHTFDACLVSVEPL